jgi:Putative peptidoglycan binding domain
VPRRSLSFPRRCTGAHLAVGAAIGVVCTALLVSLCGIPAGKSGSAAGPVAMTAALHVGAAPFPRVPDPGFPADGQMHANAGPDAPDGEARQVATVPAETPERSAFDRDPRLADPDFARGPVDSRAAEAAEAALDLTRRDRRAVQRRLALAEHGPRLVDGIFGPATRAAVTAWQAAMGLSPTGYLDRQALVLLEWQTEDRYRAWQAAGASERRRQRMRTAAVGIPAPKPAEPVTCERLVTGTIAYGRNVRCDLRGLRENLAQLFRGAERS